MYNQYQQSQGQGQQDQIRLGHVFLNPNGKPAVSVYINIADILPQIQAAMQRNEQQIKAVVFLFPNQKQPGQFDGRLILSNKQSQQSQAQPGYMAPNQPAYPPQFQQPQPQQWGQQPMAVQPMVQPAYPTQPAQMQPADGTWQAIQAQYQPTPTAPQEQMTPQWGQPAQPVMEPQPQPGQQWVPQPQQFQQPQPGQSPWS